MSADRVVIRRADLERIARVLAGLAVPVSLGLPLGAAAEPWSELHRELLGLGYADADAYAAALERRGA